MAFRLPPLSGLRLFEAAARCGSFKRAAQELNLTPGALSHGIDSLEQWLDIELFERKARGVVLTAAARQYLPYISEALLKIATGTERLPSRRFENRLSISSTALFAYKVLLPRLNKFRELYPNMIVTVEARRQPVQLPSDQFDLAIGGGLESSPELPCDLLGRITLVPVGAPDYVRGLLRDGAVDWSRATLIHTSNAGEDWEAWSNGSRIDTSSARKIVVNSALLGFEAAADGLGLAVGRFPLIEDEIATRRLTIAVDHIVPGISGYWLIRPPDAERRREIIAFRNWLLREMSQLRWHSELENRAVAKSA
jgi:LysR family transcriptional regulator, glycine cleavage system transcriptional activator